MLFFVFIKPQPALGKSRRKKRGVFLGVAHEGGVKTVGLQKQLDGQAFAAVTAGHDISALKAAAVAATLITGKLGVTSG